MSILEELREKKKEAENDIGGSYDIKELFNIINHYDLALENALLKLNNRAVEIKDLKYRIRKLEDFACSEVLCNCGKTLWLTNFMNNPL